MKKGSDFFPEFSKSQLKNLYEKEKNAKSKLRLLAAMKRKDGETLDAIAFSLEKPKTKIQDWLRRFENGSLQRVYDLKQPGKPARLSKEQLKRLEKILEDTPQKEGLPFVMWTKNLMQYLLVKKFDVRYKVRHIRNLIRALGFTFKVLVRRIRRRTKKLKRSLKKKLKKEVQHYSQLEFKIFCIDEAHFVVKPYITRG